MSAFLDQNLGKNTVKKTTTKTSSSFLNTYAPKETPAQTVPEVKEVTPTATAKEPYTPAKPTIPTSNPLDVFDSTKGFIDTTKKTPTVGVEEIKEANEATQSLYDTINKKSSYNLGETTIGPGGGSPSMDAIKSLANLTLGGGTPSTSVNWRGIGDTIGETAKIIPIISLLNAGEPNKLVNQVKWDSYEYIKNNVAPDFERAINGTKNADGTEMSTLDRVGAFAKGLVSAAFTPITYPLSSIADQNNPDNMLDPGNLINKIVSTPFTILSGTATEGLKLAGLSDTQAEDFGIVLAAVLPFARGKSKSSVTDLTTEVNRAQNQFTKISDLGPTERALYKQGALELHPDISGLPYSYMSRFNDAAAKGDVSLMNTILSEGRKEKISNTNLVRTNPEFPDNAQIRNDAVKGNEQSIINNGQYQQVAKTTDAFVTDLSGKPIVSINTVGYDDGKFSVGLEVNNPDGSITVPFKGEYPTRAEAVKQGAIEAKSLIDNPEAVSQLSKIESSPEKSIIGRDINELRDISKSLTAFDNPSDYFTSNEIARLQEDKMIADSQAKIQDIEKSKGDILRTWEKDKTTPFTTIARQKISEMVNTEKYAQIEQELINAEAGSRNFVYNQDAPGSTVTAQSSTFPDWLPSELRDRKLIDKVLKKIDDGEFISERATREQKLFDAIMKRVNPEYALYEGQAKDVLYSEMKKENPIIENNNGIKVYKGVKSEGNGKKFPLDYFTTDKKSASQYGNEVIETTIYPKKIADFTNSRNKEELRKILRDNLNPIIADEFIDRALNGKDSFYGHPLYEMVENPKVIQALKDAGYDSAKYLDFGNKNTGFARHETIAMLDVKQLKEKNKNIIETITRGEDFSDIGNRIATSMPRHGEFASKGQKALSEFENRGKGNTEEGFKLSERVQEVIKQMDTNFTKYVSPGSAGTFYVNSKNIALRSPNELGVVHHELSHLVDNSLGITKELLTPISYNTRGLPLYSKKSKPIRDQLSQVYVDTYPGARKTDNLQIRVMEGYAMLQQIALETPKMGREKYPELFRLYIDNAPELQKKLNTSMGEILADYQDLSARERINSVKTRNLNGEKGEKFLSVKERIEEFLFDAVTRFEKLDKMAGNIGTEKSVSDMLYASQNINMRVAKNLTEPGEGFWHFNGKGELEEVSKKNYSSMIAELGKKGKLDEFSDYLIARDQYNNWERLDTLKKEIEQMKRDIGDSPLKEESDILKAKQEEYGNLESILSNNSKILSREDVTKVTLDNEDYFKPYSEMFDEFNSTDLLAMKTSGLISEDRFNELSSMKGYAPMKRLIQDGLLGTDVRFSGIGMGARVGKASSLKQRTGGVNDIIDPLVSYGANHREAMLKVYKQLTMNKLYDTIVQFPDIAQEVSFKTVNIDGRVSRILGDGTKLEDAKNVIIKMVDGKPKAVAIRDDFANVLEMIFKPMERGGLEKFVVGASRRFSQGTTGIYPLYALTNLTRDQQSALINTQNGYNPALFGKYTGLTAAILTKDKLADLQYKKYIGPVMEKISEAIVDIDSKDAQYVREYMALGGEHNTSLNFNEMTGDEILSAMAKERKGLLKVKDFLLAGVDIASMPANISEIGTRVQEYAKARESGKGQWAALEYAGKVSAPFHHKGLIAKNAFARASLNAIPYLNASMQGLAQFIKTAGRDKQGAYRAAGGVAIIAAISLYIALNSVADSDEKTRQAFVNMEPSMFAKFFFIPSGNGEFTKIPITQEAGFLGGLMSMLVADAKYNAHYSTKEYVDTALSFLPDQFKLYDPERAMLSIVIQFFKPPLEIIFNKKTFPVVRDLETQSQRMQLPEFRTTPNTSAFAIKFAQSDIGKEVGLSPIQVDALLEGYLGRAVGYLTGKPSAYSPTSPFKQPEYFTSGRIIQKFYDEYGPSGLLAQKMKSIKDGKVQSTQDEDLMNYAKNRRAQEIISLMSDLKDSEANTPEYNDIRYRIWDNVNELLFDFDKDNIAQSDINGYNKKVKSDTWKEKQTSLITDYTQKFNEATGANKEIELEKQLKKEIQGESPIMTSEQKTQYNSTIKELRTIWSGDAFVKELSDTNLNAEKAAKLMQKRKEMLESGKSQADFTTYIRNLKMKKIISDEVIKKVNLLSKAQ